MKEQNTFVKKEIQSKSIRCDITSKTKLEIQSKYQIQAHAISYQTTNIGLHVNLERMFRGTNSGPPSEARWTPEGGFKGPPPEKKQTCIANGAI